MLTATNIWKSYNKNGSCLQILENVSFTVAKGEFAALRGPSGCGKSTLLLISGGLIQADKGVVSVDGTDLTRLKPDEMASFRGKNIGFVFQEFHLIPYLTVSQNINAAFAKGNKEGKDRELELLDRFGLLDRKHHYPSQLSTGERQRTALARALVNEPKLILADEPTGNLDTDNADLVLGYFREFADSGGSVLLVTHDDRAASKADRTLNINSRCVK